MGHEKKFLGKSFIEQNPEKSSVTKKPRKRALKKIGGNEPRRERF